MEWKKNRIENVFFTRECLSFFCRSFKWLNSLDSYRMNKSALHFADSHVLLMPLFHFCHIRSASKIKMVPEYLTKIICFRLDRNTTTVKQITWIFAMASIGFGYLIIVCQYLHSLDMFIRQSQWAIVTSAKKSTLQSISYFDELLIRFRRENKKEIISVDMWYKMNSIWWMLNTKTYQSYIYWNLWFA